MGSRRRSLVSQSSQFLRLPGLATDPASQICSRLRALLLDFHPVVWKGDWLLHAFRGGCEAGHTRGLASNISSTWKVVAADDSVIVGALDSRGETRRKKCARCCFVLQSSVLCWFCGCFGVFVFLLCLFCLLSGFLLVSFMLSFDAGTADLRDCDWPHGSNKYQQESRC